MGKRKKTSFPRSRKKTSRRTYRAAPSFEEFTIVTEGDMTEYQASQIRIYLERLITDSQLSLEDMQTMLRMLYGDRITLSRHDNVYTVHRSFPFRDITDELNRRA